MEQKSVDIFGNDYPTPDGTCVRDYVHVTSLARAHEKALLRLMERSVGAEITGQMESFNLGTEKGSSVLEVVRACERVTGKTIPIVMKPRRPGDPARLVGDSRRAKEVLGFSTADYPLDRVIQSAWEWELVRRARARMSAQDAIVFVDRDGTLNFDPGYLSDPEAFHFLEGAEQGVMLLKRAGFKVVVVSNQSGVGRGRIPPRALDLIHKKMNDLLGERGALIDRFALCYHRPEVECDCRKPQPKLLLDSLLEFGAQAGRSYMVGDKLSDLEAGRAAGCRGGILVRTGEGKNTESQLLKKGGSAAGVSPDFVADDFLAAAHWILRVSSERGFC